jgi:hypothetical protein
VDVAEMVVLWEIDLVVGFTSDCYFVFLWHDETVTDIGSLYNLESHQEFIGHGDLELVSPHFQHNTLNRAKVT